MKMKIMALALAMVLATAGSASAALQYDIVRGESHVAPHHRTQTITLKITSGGSLWFVDMNSHKKSGGSMTAGNYGWIGADGTLHAAAGTTKEVTVSGKNSRPVTATAYYVGDFNANDEIGFWVTNSRGTIGSSLAPITSGRYQLQTRDVDAQHYAAGQPLINFAFRSSGSMEFIAYGDNAIGGGPTGQPLPGIAATLVLCGGAYVWARRRRKTPPAA